MLDDRGQFESIERSLRRSMIDSASKPPTEFTLVYYDKMGIYFGLKPVSVMLHNRTADFIYNLYCQYHKFTKFCEGIHELNKIEPKDDLHGFELMENIVVEEKSPIYFWVDFIFIERISISLYAVSNTNLNLVNLIPNLQATIEVSYQKFSYFKYNYYYYRVQILTSIGKIWRIRRKLDTRRTQPMAEQRNKTRHSRV